MELQEAVIRHAQRDMASDRTMAQPQGIMPPRQEPSLLQELKESKLVGEVSRWVAEGAKDLHNAIVPAFPDSARGADEPGTPLNPTQYMVTSEVKGWEEELRQAAEVGRGMGQDRGLSR
jgi:hypothetical protein